MDRFNTLSLPENGERLLKQLTTQQHLHPAWSVQGAVARVCEIEHFDRSAVPHVVRGSGLEGHQAVGRLSRQQIVTLATRMASMRSRLRLDAA